MTASGLLIVLFVVACSVQCEDDPELAHYADVMYTQLARFYAKMGADAPDSKPEAWQAVLQKVKEGERMGDEFSLDAVTFDVMKLQWHNRTDGQPPLPSNACDKLMAAYETWSEMDAVVRAYTSECMTQRMRIDALRASVPSLHWVPQDLLTNSYRQIVFALDFAVSAAVFRQYSEDQRISQPELDFPAYVATWSQMSLNVSHYARMGATEEALDAFRREHSLADYMRWNNAHQQAAVEWLYGQSETFTKRTFSANDISIMTGFFDILAKNMRPF